MVYSFQQGYIVVDAFDEEGCQSSTKVITQLNHLLCVTLANETPSSHSSIQRALHKLFKWGGWENATGGKCAVPQAYKVDYHTGLTVLRMFYYQAGFTVY